jgi:hypothetical protein
MICLRCGYCCLTSFVVVVDDPEKGVAEGNLIVLDGKTRCPHLRGDKPGEYSCAIHYRPLDSETPFARHGQIEQSPE